MCHDPEGMVQALLLLATVLLVLANAFFVASEFAIVKIRPTRLEQLVREGSVRAKLALRISRHLDAYLSANQLGITLASLALGWIGEPTFAALLEPLFAQLGPIAGLSHAISLGTSFFLITTLHTVIGELAPKSLAIQRAEQVTLMTAPLLHAFYLAMYPLIWFLNGLANAFIRLFGLHPAGDEEVAHTSEELRMILARSAGGLDSEMRGMLVRIFDLRRRTARHVMSLRSDAATLRVGMTVGRAVRVAGDAGYSRYPVLDDAGREVVGYVHVRDLFDVLRGARTARVVGELLRTPIIARESTSVERLRREMQARQIPVAVVVSDSRELVGIVTIEDVLEEIVGEIRDENDEEVPPIARRGPGLVEVDGRVLLADLERETGIVLEPQVQNVETVGGYVQARLGRPPTPGESVESEGYVVVTAEVAGRRVRRVRIVSRPDSERPDAGEDDEP